MHLEVQSTETFRSSGGLKGKDYLLSVTGQKLAK